MRSHNLVGRQRQLQHLGGIPAVLRIKGINLFAYFLGVYAADVLVFEDLLFELPVSEFLLHVFLLLTFHIAIAVFQQIILV